MKKAVWICLVVMMALLMPLSAKGGAGSGAGPFRPVKLTIWTHEDANRKKLEQQLISEFTRSQSQCDGGIPDLSLREDA